ncbi:serine/threonine protein kinase [Butyrivibrio sp. YAB3001]|uniref:serine/threonine protein kinase n=1 Tax=Butyrivibrio sp. YAB3001 TaxID=1520812 RepID=UPI0008F61A42|nr:serine/threonine-protein kinase [Butyrivibrio sp. YAB3001]SFC18444.1 serine/threonine protein kinase [Butyrivibrio sp. YAB3001]
MSRYRIIKQLGQGGNSTVFMGKDLETGQKVTVKKCRAGEMGYDIHVKKSLENEARILGKLKHPAIPKLIESRDDEIVLEYVPGKSLEKVMLAEGVFKEKEALVIAKEVIAILRYLHGLREPVIYRDLKPANVVLKPNGHVSLIDFGAARIYRYSDCSDTVNLGTLGFAAPEQFGNLGQTDPRTDIYCFGMMLLQLVSGVDTKDTEAVANYKQNGVKGISSEFMHIIDKCTRPDRDDRFKSAREIEDALNDFPKRQIKRKAAMWVKLASISAVASLMISFGTPKVPLLFKMAENDMNLRIPAVLGRIANAKTRIEEMIDKKGEKDGVVSLYIYDNTDSTVSYSGNGQHSY